MKEFKGLEPVEIDGIKVNRYLTYAQIQMIVDVVKKCKNWAERETNIDMLMLHCVTGMALEEIQEIGLDVLVQSGFVDKVKATVENFYKIYHALEYTESAQRALAQIVKQLAEILSSKEAGGKRGDKMVSK